MRRLVVGALALVACTRGEQSKGPSGPAGSGANADAGAPIAVAVEDASTSFKAAAPASKWRAPVTGSGPLYVVIDGLCSELSVAPAGPRAFVTYGGTHGNLNLDHDPKKRLGLGSMALLGDTLLADGAPRVANIVEARGAENGSAWATEDTSGRSTISHRLHRWDPTSGWNTSRTIDGKPSKLWDYENVRSIQPWVDGHLIATSWSSPHFLSEAPKDTLPPGDLFTEAQWQGFGARVATHPETQSIVVLTNRPVGPDDPDYGKLLVAHWTKGKGAPDARRSFKLDGEAWSLLHMVRPDDVHIAGGKTTSSFDGRAWRKAPTAAADAVAFATYENAAILLRSDGSIATIDPVGKETKLAVPGKVETMATSGDRIAVTTDSGALFEKRGEKDWQRVALPSPVFGVAKDFKVRDVKIGSDGTLYAIGKYWEKGVGWSESELHWALLSSKKAAEVYRCNEPDPENNNAMIGVGFQSWPPRADASCKEPFVVLARKSNAKGASAHEEFAALKKKLSGEGITFVEFTSGDRVFLGATVASTAAGEELAKRATRGSRLRPEVVCGAPDASPVATPQ